jgi:F-type H+-transporting ATPase subunit alpha
MPVEEQIFVIWSATNGYLDDVAVEDLRLFGDELLNYVRNTHPGVLNTIREKKAISDDLKTQLGQAVDDFKTARWSEISGAARTTAVAA